MSVDISSILSMMEVAASGLSAQQAKLDLIAHNLANLQTAGFKRSRAAFQEVLAQATGDPTTSTWPLGGGVKLAAVQTSFSQGLIEGIDDPLALAIQGEGFFRLERPDGSRVYTRVGSFHLDGQGDMVSAQGLKLSPAVTIPAQAEVLHINPDGKVLVKLRDEAELREVGALTLSQFPNPQGLEHLGEGLYRSTEASGEAQDGPPGEGELGEIVSGAWEHSNVDLMEELVAMTLAQRAYALAARSLTVLDQMLAEFTEGG